MFALIGFYAFQVEGSGVLGFLGFLLALIGYVSLAKPSSSADLFVLGGSISALGQIMLAIGFWTAWKFPRWVPSLWFLSTLLGMLGLFLGEVAGSRSSIFIILAGVAYEILFVLLKSYLERAIIEPAGASTEGPAVLSMVATLSLALIMAYIYPK